MPWLALLVLAMAACGGDAPAPTPAPPPNISGPLKPPEPIDDSIKLDNQQRDEAHKSLAAATSADEARLARDIYKGTKHATGLDVALERKLQELDFSAFNASRAAVQKTTTPTEALAASKTYTGERYADDLNKVLWDHMNALVKKNPSLASQLPTKVEPPPTPVPTEVPGYTPTAIDAALAKANTETEMRKILAAYKGPENEAQIEQAVNMWRWSGATEQGKIETAKFDMNSRLEPRLDDTGEYLAFYFSPRLDDNNRDRHGKVRVSLYLWDDGTPVKSVEIDELCFLVPGTPLAVSCYNDSSDNKWPTRLHNLVTDTAVDLGRLGAKIHAANIMRDGKHLLGLAGGTATIWNVADGSQVSASTVSTMGYRGYLGSPTGNSLIVEGMDGKSRLFDAATGKTLALLPGAKLFSAPVCFSADGKQATLGSRLPNKHDWTGVVFDTATGAEIERKPLLALQDWLTFRISHDLKVVAAGSNQKVTDVKSGIRDMATGVMLKESVGGVVAFRGDSKRMAWITTPGQIEIIGRPD